MPLFNPARRTIRFIPLLLLLSLPWQTAQASEEKADLMALFGAPTPALPASAPLMTNLPGRDRASLNGAWNVIVDEHDMGAKGLFGPAYYAVPVPQTGMELVEFSFDERRQLQVPGDWNSQDERLFRYLEVTDALVKGSNFPGLVVTGISRTAQCRN